MTGFCGVNAKNYSANFISGDSPELPLASLIGNDVELAVGCPHNLIFDGRGNSFSVSRSCLKRIRPDVLVT